MSYQQTDGPISVRGAAAGAAYDEALRQHMLRVYNYMTSGLILTGLVAYLTASVPAFFNVVFGTPLVWLVMLAPLGFVFFLSFRIHAISAAKAQMLFWSFSLVMGLSLASIFVVFTGASVARVFFITAGMFAMIGILLALRTRETTGTGQYIDVSMLDGMISAMSSAATGR